MLPTPFLDITPLVGTAGEEGLLGMAFPPDYATDGGQFYVYYVNEAGDSVLSRFLRSASDPNVASPAERVFVTIDQPDGRTNHKGGTIAFSPLDGMLYWGLGDGGAADDPDNLAQNPQSLLGKMLRIDVSGGPTSGYTIPADNPFVCPRRRVGRDLGARLPQSIPLELRSGAGRSVDRRRRTERARRSRLRGGVRPGRTQLRLEGDGGLALPSACNPGNPCETPETASRFTFPLYEYGTHDAGDCAITGGIVYRGSVSFLKGTYLFGDSCSNQIWGLGGQGVTLRNLTASLAPTTGSIARLVNFGEDGFGEAYLVSLGNGMVFRIQ